MKKLLSLLLAGAFLLVSCPLPLFAATAEEDLAAVTQKVKDRLNIGDQYTDFQGEVQEDSLQKIWNLNWSNETGDALRIQADASGKIMQYYRTVSDEYDGRYDNHFAPAFPKLTQADAKKTAQEFLNNVLDGPVETFLFSEDTNTAEPRGTGAYYFYGTIRLNGLDSPIRASIQVRSQDNQVSYFDRSDSFTQYIGGIPSAKPAASKSQAAAVLKETLKLKIEYVLETNKETGKEMAMLRFLPVYNGNNMVDAQSGNLIDIDRLYKNINENPTGASLEEMKADSAKGMGLTPTELAGIEKIKGILSSQALDEKIRAMTELGLTSYSMADAQYTYNKAEDQYSCTLTYAMTQGTGDELQIRRKYAQVDAKTGVLESFTTSRRVEVPSEEIRTISETTALSKAQTFLGKYFKEQYAQMKPYQDTDPFRIMPMDWPESSIYRYTFAQQKNGYFFPANAYSIAIDQESGMIDSFSGSFRDVAFDTATGIISMANAVDTYNSTQETTLSYLQLPKKLDLSAPEWKPYLARGISYLYEMRLGYTLTSEMLPWAIDAKTGKPLYSEAVSNQRLAYNDLAGNAQEILKLAQYGIGYTGGRFQPSKELTQLDMAAMLVSADGYLYEPGDAESLKYLYERAYQLGILKRAQRDDSKKISRMELVKTILTMAGFDETAELPGIFKSSYADQASIAQADYGYAAIAQGLGMVKPTDGSFLPGAIATRQQAAVILHNFMSR